MTASHSLLPTVNGINVLVHVSETHAGLVLRLSEPIGMLQSSASPFLKEGASLMLTNFQALNCTSTMVGIGQTHLRSHPGITHHLRSLEFRSVR